MQTTTLGKNLTNYLQFMENVKSCSPHTLAAYQKDLEQAFGAPGSPSQAPVSMDPLAPNLGEVQLLALAKAAQTRWAPLSLASRNRKAATLKSFFRWAFQSGLLAQDLSFKIMAPQVPPKIPHFISVDEALLILKSFGEASLTPKEPDPLQSRQEEILFLLLYGGGLRVSEACQATWNKLNLESRSLRILGKGQKERITILPRLVASRLQAWQQHSKSQNILSDKSNKPLDRRTAYAWIRQRGHLVGLQAPLHPHALRHSYATHLLTGGVNLRVLQELLGHENLAATQKYTHLSLDALARTLESHHPLGGDQPPGDVHPLKAPQRVKIP